MVRKDVPPVSLGSSQSRLGNETARPAAPAALRERSGVSAHGWAIAASPVLRARGRAAACELHLLVAN